MPRYRTVQNPDGTWNVLNVPIMASVPEGARNNEDELGESWLKAALKKSQQREQEGYRAPLHIGHHEPDQSAAERPPMAGTFKLRRVGTIRHDGKKVPALFADLVGIPEWVFAEMKAGKLPYRSVEIFDPAKPEVNSLALLDSEVPFFRLPMTTAETLAIESPDGVDPFGSHIDTVSAVPQRIAASAMAGAIFSEGGAALLFKEETGVPKITLPAAVRALLEDELDKGESLTLTRKVRAFTLGDKTITFADSDDDDDSEMVKKLKQEIADLKAELKKAKAAALKDDPEDEPAPAEPAKAAEGLTPEVIKLKADVHKLSATVEDMKSEKSLSNMVATAENELKASNVHVTDAVRADLAEMAAAGPKAMATFLKAMKDGHREPIKLADLDKHLEDELEDDDDGRNAIVKLRAAHPDRADQIAAYSREYDQQKAFLRNTKREDYVKNRLAG